MTTDNNERPCGCYATIKDRWCLCSDHARMHNQLLPIRLVLAKIGAGTDAGKALAESVREIRAGNIADQARDEYPRLHPADDLPVDI